MGKEWLLLVLIISYKTGLGPFRVLHKVVDNACILDLPDDLKGGPPRLTFLIYMNTIHQTREHHFWQTQKSLFLHRKIMTQELSYSFNFINYCHFSYLLFVSATYFLNAYFLYYLFLLTVTQNYKFLSNFFLLALGSFRQEHTLFSILHKECSRIPVSIIKNNGFEL